MTDGQLSDARTVLRAKGKWLIFIAAAAAVAFIAFIVTSFLQVKQSSLVAGDPQLRDGIRITANVVDVAPADRVVRLRFAFQPVGSVSQDGQFLSEPVKVTVIGGADVVHDSYKASEIMLPADVRIPLRSGSLTMFPLDRYESTLRVEVTDAEGRPIPSTLAVEAANPGYSVQITSNSESATTATRDLTLHVSRAPTTLAFAIFASALMLILTTLAILTTFWLLRGGASESVRFMIPLILVLLFAFPALRSFIPGVPPLGVLVDFFAFFWCEIALGLCVVVVYASLMREMRKSAMDTETEEEPENDASEGAQVETGAETQEDAREEPKPEPKPARAAASS
jgi:hypothetical protein